MKIKKNLAIKLVKELIQLSERGWDTGLGQRGTTGATKVGRRRDQSQGQAQRGTKARDNEGQLGAQEMSFSIKGPY